MDLNIIQAALNGDEQAFNYIYEKTNAKAFSIAFKIAKDEHDALDILQDSYIRLYQNLHTLNDPRNLESWFNQIVKNTAINFITSKAQKTFTPFTDMESWDESESFDYADTIVSDYRDFSPEETIDYAATQDILWGIVNDLPGNQRDCVILRFRDNKKIQEIASLLEVPESTVKSRLNYAYKKIEEAVRNLEKQGTKLYGITPIAILPFLRWTLGADPLSITIYQGSKAAILSAPAAASATAAASAGTSASMSSTTAAGTTAAGATASGTGAASVTAATSAVGTGIGTAAAQTAKVGLSFAAKRIIATICTIGVLGTGAATIPINDGNTVVDYLTGNQTIVETQPIEESVEQTELMESTTEPVIETTLPEEPEPPTSEPEETEATEPMADPEILAKLPYTGDPSQLKMTAEQAVAYAQAIEETMHRFQIEYAFPEDWRFCRVALFNAGDNIPGLWITMGANFSGNILPVNNLLIDEGSTVYLSTVFTWDGASLNKIDYCRDSSYFDRDLFLTEEGLHFTRIGYGFMNGISQIYGVTNGNLSSSPEVIFEIFNFEQAEMPTIELVRSFANDYGKSTIPYNYSSITPEKWSNEYTWQIGVVNGQFVSLSEENMLKYNPPVSNWILGHGQAGHTDQSHTWKGNWADGEEVLQLLHQSVPADYTGMGIQYNPDFLLPPSTGAYETSTIYYPVSQIQHTDFITSNTGVKIFCEIPLFDNPSLGYQKVNKFFLQLRDDFFADPSGNIDTVISQTDMLRDYAALDPFTWSYSAKIHDHTDRFVSITMTANWFAGGAFNQWKNGYTFFSNTGEPVQLTDLYDGSEEEIVARLRNCLEQYYGEQIPDEYITGLDSFQFYISSGVLYVGLNTLDSYYYEKEMTPIYSGWYLPN